MSNYVVPEGMLKAARKTEGEWLMSRSAQAATAEGCSDVVLAAALRWQSENPQMPTDEQLASMRHDLRFRPGVDFDIQKLCGEWLRRMYLAPEPEATDFDSVRRYANISTKTLAEHEWVKSEDYDSLLEAYRRGRRSASTASR